MGMQMRIHTNVTDQRVLFDAANVAGVSLMDGTRYGSRSHATAFEVKLSGSSSRPINSGRYGSSNYSSERAATWDEWGIFLGHIFDQDSTAKATYYHDADDFHFQTGDRFRTLKREDQHRQHKWEFIMLCTGPVNRCKCGSTVRREHLKDYIAREGGNVFEVGAVFTDQCDYSCRRGCDHV